MNMASLYFPRRPLRFMELCSKFDGAIIVIYGPPKVTSIRYDSHSQQFRNCFLSVTRPNFNVYPVVYNRTISLLPDQVIHFLCVLNSGNSGNQTFDIQSKTLHSACFHFKRRHVYSYFLGHQSTRNHGDYHVFDR